jgi:hypothetical protein
MKTILSIDGGGIKGIIPALVLAEIERRTGKPVCQMFDLIAGSSTGGILALLLSVRLTPTVQDRPAYSAQDLYDFYDKRGKEIFSGSLWRNFSSLAGLADEKYDHGTIEKVLSDYMGNSYMGDGLAKVLVTAYDIEARSPYFFKSWKFPGSNTPMAVAARATSAAPTYFEPVKVKDGCALVDGGVYSNNPAMCAYAEARRMWPDETEFVVLSLGCGEHTRPIHYSDAKNWGLAKWAVPILNVVFDGQSDAVAYQLTQILGDNHIRIQGRLDIASDDMDDASAANRAALKQEAEKIILANGQALNRVCEILKS